MAVGSNDATRPADLVLEGGGVKGVALVGAVTTLHQAGYRFERVAGTSAGAVVGALIAAGATPDRLRGWMATIDYLRFADRSLLDRVPVVGPTLSILVEKGIFEGTAVRRWVHDRLAELGVETFGDLRRDDPGSHLPPQRRHRLVVTATDLTLGRLVRLPWDYHLYGLEPDEQPVADAVRASTAIPYFYEPVGLRDARGEVHYLVDGGLLSNFPIELFDRDDGRPPRFPTIGVKLSARPDGQGPAHRIRGPASYLRAVIGTLLVAQDWKHLHDPCVTERTIFVDTGGISAVDFALSSAQAERLFASGVDAAQRWLGGWDWDAHVARCRP